MRVEDRDVRSAAEVAQDFDTVLGQVESGRIIVVMKGDRAVSAIIPLPAMEQLDTR